jgi:OOP family OmpA-OmpF porin
MRAPSVFMLATLALSVSQVVAAGPAVTGSARDAGGNPAYLTDSNGIVVRSSQGECWRTGTWSSTLATVVGCDGVLAKATPVPAPAPSPKPEPVPAAESQARVQPDARASEPSLAAPVPVPVPAPTLADRAVQQPTAEKVTLDTDTYFDFDQATLKPEGKRKLDELASRIAAMQLEVVVATGHTDWTGADAYNQKLSERRALSVKNYLVEKGLPADRIFTEGKGEKQPVAKNTTREGRARNRRVDVELVGTRR